MKKLPIKQIYLLLIIVVGIVSLSVYSTYALFTYDKETGKVVHIGTPNNLLIHTSINEYRRISIPSDTEYKVDIDINNPKDIPLCYSVWYNDFDKNITVLKDEHSITNGIIESKNILRTSLIIINDSEESIDVNLGIATSEYNNTCSLDLPSNKKIITENYTNNYLVDYVKNAINKEVKKDANYEVIKDIKILNLNDNLTIANKFTFKDGIFTLEDSYQTTLTIFNNDFTKEKDYYICENNDHCNILYKIKDIDNGYTIDKYIGFTESNNGILEYNNNYVYYGGNPDNYICFNDEDNCELWRIIGIFYNTDKKYYNTKIIKDDYLFTMNYKDYSTDDDENTIYNDYKDSNIDKIFNKYYLNTSLSEDNILSSSLSVDSINKIIPFKYNLDYNNNLDVKVNNIYTYNSKNDYTTKVGLMSFSDYLYAGSCTDKNVIEYNGCTSNNYLYKNSLEYTMTRVDTTLDKVYTIGIDNYIATSTEKYNVRPVLYLKPRITVVKGNGTISDPYIIK